MTIVPMTAEELTALRDRRDRERREKIWWSLTAEEAARAYEAGERNFIRADLSGADLRGAVLSDADLRGADLSDAILRGAILRGVDLRDAILRDAILRDAILRDAILRDADLRGVDLRDADLRGVDLRGARNIWAVYAPDMSSRGDFLYVVDHSTDDEAKLMVRMGCWWGDMAAAKERVTAVKGADCAYLLYLSAIETDWQRQRESEAE